MSTKISLYIATSLDGFIAPRDGSVKWLDKFTPSEGDNGYGSFISSIDTILMGRTTYDQVLTFGDYPYKDQKGYVFSHKKRTDDNVTFVSGDVKDFINGLDPQKEHNIWVIGGADIINQFLKYNLVDEFRIFVMPVLLGEGIRLFSNDNPKLQLTFIDTNAYKPGLVELRYKRL